MPYNYYSQPLDRGWLGSTPGVWDRFRGDTSFYSDRARFMSIPNHQTSRRYGGREGLYYPRSYDFSPYGPHGTWR